MTQVLRRLWKRFYRSTQASGDMVNDYDKLVEQAREWSSSLEADRLRTPAALLAGLADAVEQLQREWDYLNNARIEEKNRTAVARARVAELEATNKRWREEIEFQTTRAEKAEARVESMRHFMSVRSFDGEYTELDLWESKYTKGPDNG